MSGCAAQSKLWRYCFEVPVPSGFRFPDGACLAVYNLTVADPEDLLIISTPIKAERLAELAAETFGDMVKAVVDVSRRVIALGGELHSDEEAALLAGGSSQGDLWGINIYPDKARPEWVEFDSMINVRPRMGNPSRSVDDPGTRDLILEVVAALIE